MPNEWLEDMPAGTGLPVVSGVSLGEKGPYYIACLINQRIADGGVVWNYAVINRDTQYAEAYSSSLPGAIMSLHTLADKLEELLHEGQPHELQAAASDSTH